MQSLEILQWKISITKLGKLKREEYWDKYDWRQKNVKYRPATLGHFTIGELFHMLNVIQLQPYRRTFSFIFRDNRFQVTVYKDEEPEDDDENKISVQTNSKFTVGENKSIFVHPQTDGGNTGK